MLLRLTLFGYIIWLHYISCIIFVDDVCYESFSAVCYFKIHSVMLNIFIPVAFSIQGEENPIKREVSSNFTGESLFRGTLLWGFGTLRSGFGLADIPLL